MKLTYYSLCTYLIAPSLLPKKTCYFPESTRSPRSIEDVYCGLISEINRFCFWKSADANQLETEGVLHNIGTTQAQTYYIHLTPVNS